MAIPIDAPDDASDSAASEQKTPRGGRKHRAVIKISQFLPHDYPSKKESYRAILRQIIDTFVAEISRRLVESGVTLQLLGTSDPKSRKFLNKEIIKTFCQEFSSFGIEYSHLRRNEMGCEKMG